MTVESPAHFPPPRKPALTAFLESDVAGGVLLMLAAAIAMILANSPWAEAYQNFLHTKTGPNFATALGPMTVHLWINDGLMAVFFFFVGLEVKRELLDGRLATWSQRRLPVIAAIAGMAVPAIVYTAVIGARPDLLHGWAIPAATDIAFAIGVLALLGKRAPTALKLFLVTVAIVDDIGAIAIIAVFYSSGLNWLALVAAGMILTAMILMNRGGVRSMTPYIVGAILLWYAILCSGVHATIAGVVAAMTIPLTPSPGAPDSEESLLHQFEHMLATPVNFGIVPLFGLANAGVSLAGGILGLGVVPLAVGAGLFLGKQIGIFSAVWLAVKTGIAERPRGSSWLQVYGVAVLSGIGFTMSLFIGALAFAEPDLVDGAKVGTLAGSLLSALLGYCVLRFAPQPPGAEEEEAQMAAEIAADGDIAHFADPDTTRI
jgi:NhaA family Na+:H+ antiporter